MDSEAKGGLVVAFIGALMAAADGSFLNIDIRGLGVVIVIIGLIVYLSKK